MHQSGSLQHQILRTFVEYPGKLNSILLHKHVGINISMLTSRGTEGKKKIPLYPVSPAKKNFCFCPTTPQEDQSVLFRSQCVRDDQCCAGKHTTLIFSLNLNGMVIEST